MLLLRIKNREERHYLFTNAIGMKNILIVDVECDDTTRNLFLRNLQFQHLLFRKGQLVEYQHVTICLLEALGTV